MSNELISLSTLFQNRLFRIPDYQRGYAWKKEQLDKEPSIDETSTCPSFIFLRALVGKSMPS
jgi:hypothetical protein